MSIISSVINDIDNVTNESTMSTLCAMAESYDKMQMITESCDRTCDLSEFSVFQEAKQQQEGFFKRIINLIKGFFTAIFNRITGKKNPANKKEILDNIQKAKKADKSKRAAIFGALLGAAGGAAAGAVGTKMASKSKLNEANAEFAKKQKATEEKLAEAEKANAKLVEKQKATKEKLTKAEEDNKVLAAKVGTDAKQAANEAELIEKIKKLDEELTQLKETNKRHESDKKKWESDKDIYWRQIEDLSKENETISATSQKYNDALDSLIKTVMDVYGPGEMTNLLKHMTNNWTEPVSGLDELRKIVNKYDTEFAKKREELSRALNFKVEINGSGLITYDSSKDEVLCNFEIDLVMQLITTLYNFLSAGVDVLEAIVDKEKYQLKSYKDGSRIRQVNIWIKEIENELKKRNTSMHKLNIERAADLLEYDDSEAAANLKKFNDLSGKLTDELINETKAEYPEAIEIFTKLNSELPRISSITQGYIDLINMAVKEYNEIIVKSGLISSRLTVAPRIAFDNVRVNGRKNVNNSTSQSQANTGKQDKTDESSVSKAKAEYKKAVEDFVNEHGKKPTRKKAQQMSSEIIKKYGLERGTVIWESVEEFLDDEDEVVRDSSTSWYY